MLAGDLEANEAASILTICTLPCAVAHSPWPQVNKTLQSSSLAAGFILCTLVRDRSAAGTLPTCSATNTKLTSS